MSLAFTTKIVSSAASDKKKSSDKSSLEVLPLRTAADDCKPFPEVSAVPLVVEGQRGKRAMVQRRLGAVWGGNWPKLVIDLHEPALSVG